MLLPEITVVVARIDNLIKETDEDFIWPYVPFWQFSAQHGSNH